MTALGIVEHQPSPSYSSNRIVSSFLQFALIYKARGGAVGGALQLAGRCSWALLLAGRFCFAGMTSVCALSVGGL